MEPQFWHERWELSEIGFHQPEVSSLLKSYWRRVCPPASGSLAFVPLCGKSLDMLWLRNQGHSVLGVELSPIAVGDFFREQGLAYSARPVDGFQSFRGERVELLCGDFFALRPDQVKDVAAVYDRASLIALPKALQSRYAEHLIDLLPHRPPILLITLEYDPTEMDGPPFSTPESKVRDLFGPAYRAESLSVNEVLVDYPGLRDRGLTWLTETAYRLHSPPA